VTLRHRRDRAGSLQAVVAGYGNPLKQKQLIGLVAGRHGVDVAAAHRILWRRCISPRVRLTLALLGWMSPKTKPGLKLMLKGFGRCDSFEGARHDIIFYKSQLMDRAGIRSMLFGFSGRRMLRVAKYYFDTAQAR
jgi:hypothetical protein